MPTVSQESVVSNEDCGDFESQRRRSTSGGMASFRQTQSRTYPIQTFCMLLASGCSLALLSQYMARIGVTLPRAQILTWTRFAFKFTVSSLIDTRGPRNGDRKDSTGGVHPPSPQAGPSRRFSHFIIIAMGFLDVAGYSLSSFGFQALGSSLGIVISSALGQILTALTRRLILKKRLSLQQSFAVAVVSLGLLVRGVGIDAHHSSYHALVVPFLFLFLSSLCYALVGIGFEWVVMSPNAPDNSFIQRQMSMIGTILLSFYILICVYPHRQELVFDLINSSGVSRFFVFLLYFSIGAVFTGHSFVQAHCIKSRGVVAVNIVNALRSVVVPFCSSLLFCHHHGDRECLSFWSIVGAGLVCSGVVLFSTSRQAKEEKKGREKRE